MSLSKQLLILISALFLMVFSINFALSVSNIKSYLEGEAEVHAQDTATSLGVSLSPYMMNEKDPIIKTTMNAIFDMGYYQEIKLVNVDNEPLVTLTNEKTVEDVPSWFIDFFPMKMSVAESEISSGWNITGIIYVSLNPGYAYLKLYEQAVRSFYYSLAIFILSMLLLLLVLRITLRPLKKIDQLAIKISNGKFEVIEELPWTTEVKNVTTSMNLMSKKIEGAINSLNIRLEDIGQKLQRDELTGLKKKNSFDLEMKNLFMEDITAFVFMIKIDGLSSLVKVMGHDSIDLFLKDFSAILEKTKEQERGTDISIYRFFGSEFSLIVKQISFERVEALANVLSLSFSKLGEKYQKPDIAHIGVAAFNPVGTIDGILLAANEAYEQAKLIGANSYYIRQGDDQAKDIAEWKSLVFNIIDNQDYEINFVGHIKSLKTGQLIMEEAFTQVTDKNGALVKIGTFVSIAEKFSKIVDLDKGIILRVIDYIKTEDISHSVAINLSTRTIKNSDFRSWLYQIIHSNQGISSQLVFSMSSYAMAKDIEVYKGFIAFAQKLNARIIVKRFETQSMSPEIAKELKPDYIRLARDICNGVSIDSEKRAFVETMQGIGELLDIDILAENIHLESDFLCLKDLGITGASR